MNPHLGGHEGGVHGLNGPQASVCEHYQQGGQQVTISLLVLFIACGSSNSTGWFYQNCSVICDFISNC